MVKIWCMMVYMWLNIIILFFLLILPLPLLAEEARPILPKIKEGQELLSVYKISKPAKLVKGEDRIALAVLDQGSGKVEIINISVIGKKVKVLDKDKLLWKVELRRNNGVNSEFKALLPEQKIVMAMKYPVFMRKQGKKGEIRVPTDVVYSAYSSALESPEVVANGQAYVDNLIAATYDKLNALGVRSRAFPDRLITEALNKQMVESLILIEHIGTTTLLGDFDGALRRLYTTFGLNTVNTFDYARSSVGARGIAQFMPNTYKAVRAKWPELKLKANFEEAMMDHENATLAQLALMDLHLAALPPEIRKKAIEDHVKTGEYLAASYNGGVGRINKAIKSWGELWSESHLDDLRVAEARHGAIDAKITSLKKQIKKAKTGAEAKKLRAELAKKQREHDVDYAELAKFKKGTLRAETVGYLKKLRPVYAHLKLRQDLIDAQDMALRQALSGVGTSIFSEAATSTLAADIQVAP